MGQSNFHWLDTADDAFAHVSVSESDQVQISVGYYRIQMDMDTAEQVVDVLQSYLTDRQIRRDEYFGDVVSERERMQQAIKEEESDGI